MSYPKLTAEQTELRSDLSAAEAQDFCNFVLFAPTTVPSDCSVALDTRVEAAPGRTAVVAHAPAWTEANTASAMWRISGKRRAMTLKMFLYDWAVPVADQPSLWGHATHAVSLPGAQVLWHGLDYRDRQAFTTRRDGTRIEAASISGEWSLAEIVSIIEGLAPADNAARLIIRDLPFAQRSYWARHRVAYPTVPDSLWNLQGAQALEPKAWRIPDGWDDDAIAVVRIAQQAGFEPDSTASTSSGSGEIVLRGPEGEPDSAWIRWFAVSSRTEKYWPPLLDEHPAESRQLARASGGAHAWVPSERGPHDFIWKQGGKIFVLQALGLTGDLASTIVAELEALPDRSLGGPKRPKKK